METKAMSDEQVVRQKWGERVKFYEGGDGCHILIDGVHHPHFYGNMPCNAWSKALAFIEPSRS